MNNIPELGTTFFCVRHRSYKVAEDDYVFTETQKYVGTRIFNRTYFNNNYVELYPRPRMDFQKSIRNGNASHPRAITYKTVSLRECACPFIIHPSAFIIRQHKIEHYAIHFVSSPIRIRVEFLAYCSPRIIGTLVLFLWHIILCR